MMQIHNVTEVGNTCILHTLSGCMRQETYYYNT